MTDIPKLSKSEIAQFSAYLPHIHVIAHGSKDEALGLMKNASTGLVKALSTAVKQTGGTLDGLAGFQGTGVAEILKSDERLDRRTAKFQKLAEQTGGDFGSVMQSIGKTALQLAPAILPLLL